MKTKILSIEEFANADRKKDERSVAELRVKLASADALWPFGWY